MKDETRSVGIQELFGMKPKMHSVLVGDNSEHKKRRSRRSLFPIENGVNIFCQNLLIMNTFRDKLLLIVQITRHFHHKQQNPVLRKPKDLRIMHS